jgi:hypothetical protein
MFATIFIETLNFQDEDWIGNKYFAYWKAN